MHILPGLLPSSDLTFMYYFTRFDLFGDIVYSMYVTYCIYYNYYKCISTDPGSPSLGTKGHDYDIEEDVSSSSSTGEPLTITVYSDSITSDWSYCKKCQQPKPPRCHHCNVCNKCVLKMDHHCRMYTFIGIPTT
ncbi:hypothetical protein SAMD00019534_107520 [Acytostelium subglobosum LB1]|uniref:hypothetical protein n=1 Tax=Acytostelium subglobosum LB1 TaxID=1410327 RepID=UPI000644C964|nr:hypothetical protein SAMD00019534_107520 [Acytostelium subglobosum LB1]GAM27576.1 hypothetical protein SAMD00019534_107520 [Acytostelium subglobosum LB1]|eukprot:XP_012749641.1 hypothetical protein SAMD00019534_107520 [Acytostelium subglobosum LB1]